MTLTNRQPARKAIEKSIEKFIASVLDAMPAHPTKTPLMRGKREQISHTIPPALLARLDARVEATGMTRAGLINQAIFKYLDSENA